MLRYILQAKQRGIGVIFITHNPHHAYPVGDHFVILRRGQVFGDYAKAEIPLEQLVQMMAGGADLEALSHELDAASRTGDTAAAELAEAAQAFHAEAEEAADIVETPVEGRPAESRSAPLTDEPRPHHDGPGGGRPLPGAEWRHPRRRKGLLEVPGRHRNQRRRRLLPGTGMRRR